jgi:peptide/nickel transport system permease protein
MTSKQHEGALSEQLAEAARRRQRRFDGLKRLLARRTAVVGLALILFVVLLALTAPLLSGYDPLESNFPQKLKPPSAGHLMGTDAQGRDLFSRLTYGARISLQVGIIASLSAVAVGAVWALIVGYAGGVWDNLTGMLMDLILAFPTFLFVLTLMAVLGPSLFNVMLAVIVTSIPRYVRVMRGEVLSVKERTYIEAARAVGVGPFRTMFRHLLPNTFMPLLVLFTLQVPGIIMTEASLSFLGAGVPPSVPTWGNMINEGRNYMQTGWWMSLFPSLGIILTVLGFNLFGDGLRDALDPRLRGQDKAK